MTAKKTHQEFVDQFNQKHEGKGYRVVGEYIDAITKIAIECPTHGIWTAKPDSLLTGRGCRQCGIQRRANKQRASNTDFVTKFNRIHKGKDYQLVGEYLGTHIKTAIKCPTHGIWKATPAHLLQGKGCPQCGFKQRADKKRITHTQFLTKLNQVHEGKGYQVVSEYIGTHTKIAFECPVHGIWEAAPSDLLQGQGCPKCGFKQRADKRRKPQHEFMAQFNQRHEGKGYQVVGEYIGTHTKIAIQCSIHGIWKATPHDLLQGCGCPGCTKTGFNPSKEAVFYLLEIDKDKNTYYGFGISNRYEDRKKEHLKNLNRSNAILKNEWTYKFEIGYECRELESHLKYLLKEKGLAFNLEIEGFLDECAVETAFPMILRCIDESKHERHRA